jgi:inositol transport system ATP-binding protein
MVSPTTIAAVRASGAIPNAEYLLAVEGVRKEFPGVVALDDVSFRLKRGTVHALMGENGAGKSTLMKILAGIYTPDKGEIKFKGVDIQLKSPLDALENGIAMIHQELNLMPFMTVAENIWIRREPLTRFGFVDHGEMNRKTADLFKRLNIALDPESEVRDLSIANRQMVEIAKAVSYESDVLIMDEPTSALTEREVAHLFTIIRDLRSQGIGIVYITHKMNELFEIADEFSVFRDGKYIGTHASTGRDPRRHHQDDGWPRNHPDVPERGSSDRRCRSVSERPLSERRLPRRVVRCARRRNPWCCRPCRLRPLECAETLFGVTPASSGSIAINGKAVSISSPTEAIRNRMAFLTEDRKDTGCLLILDVLENMQIAVLQDKFVNMGFVDQKAVSAKCEEMARKLRVKTPNLQERIENLSRRQPAEGTDRALAFDRPAHPHSRRADARHRCRREGRNSPAGHRTRPRRRCRHHDFVGNARSSRHERPRHGDARRPGHGLPRPGGSDPGQGHGTCSAVMARF